MRGLILAAALLVAGTVEAGAWMARGAGLSSCGTWTADRRAERAYSEMNWVLGFLSGAGFVAPNVDPLDGVDAEGVFGWVDNYCLAHPIQAIAIAAEQFLYAHPHR